jgi:cell division protein FtsW (lipid II flippase)
MRKLSWILLTLAGALTLLGSLASTHLAYSGDYPIGGVPVAEVAQGREGLEPALRAMRGTAAAYAGGFAVLYLFVVLGPYRRGERWSWWAVLAALLVLVSITVLRVPLLGTQGGVAAALIQGGVGIVALLLDVRRLSRPAGAV